MSNHNPIPEAVSQVSPSPQPIGTKPSSTTMWDAFEHILMFISLYVMAVSIALIMNFFVDKWFPGITSNSYSSYITDQVESTTLRAYMAALIVSFPLFAFFFLHITKRTISNSNMRNMKARKVLIYITLTVTFIIMLSSIITTVFNFLNGNLSVNFLFHILVTLIVSGIVFGYYFYQIKEDRKINV